MCLKCARPGLGWLELRDGHCPICPKAEAPNGSAGQIAREKADCDAAEWSANVTPTTETHIGDVGRLGIVAADIDCHSLSTGIATNMMMVAVSGTASVSNPPEPRKSHPGSSVCARLRQNGNPLLSRSIPDLGRDNRTWRQTSRFPSPKITGFPARTQPSTPI